MTAHSQRKNSGGMAIVTVILVMMFVIPMAMWVLSFVSTQLKQAQKEKQLKLSGSVAGNALVDYMRQFSQNYYEGHYDTDALARPTVFYEQGFSSVTVLADAQQHRLNVTAIGTYGDSTNPLADRVLQANIQFISDLTDYGTFINGTFTLSASGITYYGKWWITGDLAITGSNVTFIGGPLIVGGKITGGSGCRVYGNLYYGGSSKGSVTVYGNTYNFYPSDMVYPTINETYYRTNCNYKITQTLVGSTFDPVLIFQAYTSSSAVRISKRMRASPYTVTTTTVTYPIIPTGTIFLTEDCDVHTYGTVRGRVTLCVLNITTRGSLTVGMSNLNGNLLYYNNLTGGTTTYAFYGNSFSAIAESGLTFQGKTTATTSDLKVCGVYFNRASGNTQVNGSSGRVFWLYGSRNKPFTFSGWADYNLFYDQYLNTYPPPGLPERPVLINYVVK